MNLGEKIKESPNLVEFSDKEYLEGLSIRGRTYKIKGEKYYYLKESDSRKTVIVSLDGIVTHIISQVTFEKEHKYWEGITRNLSNNIGNAYSFHDDIKMWVQYNECTILTRINNIENYTVRIDRFPIVFSRGKSYNNWILRLKKSLTIKDNDFKKAVIYALAIIFSAIIISIAYSYTNRFMHLKGPLYYDKWNKEVINIYKK